MHQLAIGSPWSWLTLRKWIIREIPKPQAILTHLRVEIWSRDLTNEKHNCCLLDRDVQNNLLLPDITLHSPSYIHFRSWRSLIQKCYCNCGSKRRHYTEITIMPIFPPYALWDQTSKHDKRYNIVGPLNDHDLILCWRNNASRHKIVMVDSQGRPMCRQGDWFVAQQRKGSRYLPGK
jgi:hypothetical protein